MKKSIYFSVLIFIFIACKAKKEAAENKETAAVAKAMVLPDSIYRFTVSFISIGAGTDRKVKEEFNLFISRFNEKNHVVVIAETAKWGREGETDYCFKLNELNPQQQEMFVTEAKELLKSSTLVRCAENSVCSNKAH